MSEIDIKIIGIDDLHKTMVDYIKENKVTIKEYEEIKECVLKMIREGYLFNVDRDRLRDAMEDITYMYSPNDDLNKDRVNKGLEYEYSDEEEISDEEEDEDDSGIMNKNSMELMSSMMRDPAFGELLGNLGLNPSQSERSESKKCEECPEKEETKEEPVVEETKEEPVVEEPVVEESKEESKEESASEEPVEESKEEPVEESVEETKEEPVVEESVEESKEESASEEPVEETKEEPVKEQ